MYLISFSNRLVVLINWARCYLRWPSGPRLILADPNPASRPPSSVAAPSLADQS